MGNALGDRETIVWSRRFFFTASPLLLRANMGVKLFDNVLSRLCRLERLWFNMPKKAFFMPKHYFRHKWQKLHAPIECILAFRIFEFPGSACVHIYIQRFRLCRCLIANYFKQISTLPAPFWNFTLWIRFNTIPRYTNPNFTLAQLDLPLSSQKWKPEGRHYVVCWILFFSSSSTFPGPLARLQVEGIFDFFPPPFYRFYI